MAFERVPEETLRTRAMRICAYCVMPNHWHFVLWPERDGELSAFLPQLTNTHVERWKEHRREARTGYLYQGRFKCFPVQTDAHFYDVVRYVARNALRANLNLHRCAAPSEPTTLVASPSAMLVAAAHEEPPAEPGAV